MKQFIIILFFSFLLISCKAGYILEYNPSELSKEQKSGYYYKTPTYHIK